MNYTRNFQTFGYAANVSADDRGWVEVSLPEFGRALSVTHGIAELQELIDNLQSAVDEIEELSGAESAPSDASASPNAPLDDLDDGFDDTKIEGFMAGMLLGFKVVEYIGQEIRKRFPLPDDGSVPPSPAQPGPAPVDQPPAPAGPVAAQSDFVEFMDC